MMDNNIDEEVLTPVEATPEDLTLADYKRLSHDKDQALIIAEDRIKELQENLISLRTQAGNDINMLNTINKNTIAYSKKKEDAVLKVMQGLTDLMFLDRTVIIPKEKEGGNSNGN